MRSESAHALRVWQCKFSAPCAHITGATSGSVSEHQLALDCGPPRIRNWFVRNILCLICLAIANTPAVGQETVPVVQSFDTDPGWDGFRNRLRPKTMPVVRQDFGYQKTRFAGGSDVDEIGGVVQRAYRRAVCAKRIPVRTLNDSLTASGRFTVRDARGGSGVLIGWFNDETSQGWRTPDSLAMRIDGNDGNTGCSLSMGQRIVPLGAAEPSTVSGIRRRRCHLPGRSNCS